MGAAPVEDEVDRRRVGEELDLGPVVAGGEEGPFDLPAGDVPGVHDAAAGVAPLAAEVELPVGPGVEMCAQRRQLVDPLRALAHGDRHRLGVVQTRPGVHGVRHVLLEAVPLREDGGHSPLCIHGVALGAAALGEDGHRTALCGLECERQASHTAAEHQEVEPLGHGTVL
jgi:hypothetical protein